MEKIEAPFPCPECGSKTYPIQEGRTIGTKCTKCDWSVVTTYIPPIEQDNKIYTIKICNGDYHNENQIKLISKLAGVNFLQARELLRKHDSTVFSGKASETKRVKTNLESLNIIFKITPRLD